MFKSPERGVLLKQNGSKPTSEEIARLVGTSEVEVGILMKELESNGVPSRRDDGALYNRRMVRDEDLRRVRAAAGRLGGRHGKKEGGPSKPKANPKQKPPPPTPTPSSTPTPRNSNSAKGEAPRPLASAARQAGIAVTIVEGLTKKYEETRLVAWLLMIADDKRVKRPAAYLRGCLKKGVDPPQGYLDEAKQQMLEHDQKVAMRNGGLSPFHRPEAGAKRCKKCGIYWQEGASSCTECGCKAYRRDKA
jgi:hypothetical protein